MGEKSKKQSKLIRLLKAPIRILCRARDLYVGSLTDCASRTSCDVFMGCPTGPVYPLPRSFSTNSSASSRNEDFRELVRACSTNHLGNKVETDLLRPRPPSSTGSKMVPRSFSAVAVGRIDEDKPCDFGDDIMMYPRSRSCAVTGKPTFCR